MLFYRGRYSILHKAIVLAVVCLFLVNDIAWALDVIASPRFLLSQESSGDEAISKITTLAPQSEFNRITPFLEKHGLDLKNRAGLIYAAGALKKLFIDQNFNETKIRRAISRLNTKTFPAGDVKIEEQIQTCKLIGNEYKYVTFEFTKDKKTVHTLFLKDYDKLAPEKQAELRKELEIKDEEKHHLDCPGLEGIWFINPIWQNIANTESVPQSYASSTVWMEPHASFDDAYGKILRGILDQMGDESKKRFALAKNIGPAIEKAVDEILKDHETTAQGTVEPGKNIKIAIIPLGSVLKGYARPDSDMDFRIFILDGTGPNCSRTLSNLHVRDEIRERMRNDNIISNQRLHLLGNITEIGGLIMDRVSSPNARDLSYLFLPIAYGDPVLIEKARSNIVNVVKNNPRGTQPKRAWDYVRNCYYRAFFAYSLVSITSTKNWKAKWFSWDRITERVYGDREITEKELRSFNKRQRKEIGLPAFFIMEGIYKSENGAAIESAAQLDGVAKKCVPVLSSTAQDEAVRIHNENLKYTPALPEKTILCHIITDSILPEGQRGMLKILDINMRDESYTEKIISLSAESPDKFIEELNALMVSQRKVYEGYTVQFDVACPSTEIVGAVLESNLGVKALAFEPCRSSEADVAQVEGIVMALRALNSGKIEALREVFRILAGKELSLELSGITDIDELVKRIVFVLPAAKIINYNRVKQLNETIRKNIESAA